MGYRTQAYAVDIDRIRATFGSQDRAMLGAIENDFADDFRDNDEVFAEEIRRGAPTLHEALAQVIAGTIPSPEQDGFQHGYAIELLCKHLGHPLDGEDLIEFIDDLELPTGLNDSGPPLPIPQPLDFPCIGFLTAEQVREEYALLEDRDLAHDSTDIEEARKEFRDYLRQAKESGLGLVTFAY